MKDDGAVSRPYDDSYLMAYSEEHVAYEFDMFLWSARLCASGSGIVSPDPVDARRLNNVLIEDFVLHLRNIIDFLYKQKQGSKPTDVVAADFCEPNVWKPTIPEVLEVARIRANKEIAHLTTDRITGIPASKAWDFACLLEILFPEMNLFVDKALESRLSPTVAEVIA